MSDEKEVQEPRELLQAIADDLNNVTSRLDLARPSWNSYQGSGDWDVEYIVKAVEELACAVARLAGLRETTGRGTFVLPDEVEDEDSKCPHGYDSPHKILSDEVLPGDTLGELCWP